ncbi:MAG TPA: Rv3654c family TadE-like protein [Naasia sp.]|jgi:secretion/DNA translocation related TadE-like protein
MVTADRGSGTAATVGVAAAVVLLAGMAVPLYMQLAERRSLAAAADAAALGAADSRSGAAPGFPCPVAAAIAAAHGAEIASCVVDDLVVTVRVVGSGGSATARAGPPGSADRHGGGGTDD